MAVKFQSEDYYKEANNALQSNEAVLGAAKGQNVTIQIVTTDTPDGGESKSFLKIVDGVPEVGLGEIEGAEATITQNYETAIALDKGELNSQNAFMQGKIKIQGNLMKLMQLQPFLQSLGPAAAHIEREY